MKIATMVMMAAMIGLGTAHADSQKAGLGFDRVGTASNDRQRAADDRASAPLRVSEAPGEDIEANVSNYPARKREMARRLVWLMLSAR